MLNQPCSVVRNNSATVNFLNPRTGLAVLLLAALTLAFFWKIAFTNLILVGLDVFTYFYPYRAYAAEALRGGRIPLWNPYLFLGAPFLANIQAAVFYPLNWPLCWLSAPRMISYSIIIHIFLASLFTYLYARLSIGLSHFGAFLAAIVFAFSGFLGARVEHVNQLNIFAWMPLSFLLLDLALGQGSEKRGSLEAVGERIGYLLLAGLVTAMQFTAGHIQAAYICLFALGVYTLIGSREWGVASGNKTKSYLQILKGIGGRLAIYILIVALGAALTAVQLLPTYELSRLSIRSKGLSYREAVSFSIRPHLLPYSLLPIIGVDLREIFGESFAEYVGYVGLLALTLALVGAFLGPGGRHKNCFITLAVLGFFLAFGLYNPLYFVFYKLVPGFALFRAPARWLYLYTFGLAMLAGLGADTLLQREFKARVRALVNSLWEACRPPVARWLMIGSILILVILALIFMDFPAWTTWLAWLGLILIAALLLWVAIAGLPVPVFRPILAGLIIGELWAASRGLAYNNPTAPEALSFLRTAPAHLLTDQGLHRFISMSGITYDPGDLEEIERILEAQLSPQAIYDYVVAAKRKEILAFNLPLLYKLFSVDGYDGGVLPLERYMELQRLFLAEDDLSPDGRLREQLKEVPEARLLSLLNVKYVITDKVFDVWIDDIFYDLEHTARLGQGAVPGVTVTDLPDFAATSLGLVSYLVGAGDLADGTPVAQVLVTDSRGSTQRHVLQAGLDTAEGEYEAAAMRCSVRHAKARVGHHWRDNPDGNDYITVLELGTALVPSVIEIDYLAGKGQLHLRGLSLIDRRTGTHRSVTVSTSGRFRLVHSGDVKIYENLDNLPRAFVVHRARVIADDRAAVAAIRDASFRPDQEAILAEGQALNGEGERMDRVEVISYQPERVVVTADLAEEGYLILTDTYYPGWQAAVDGLPAPLRRADILFRALYLPPGSHTVELVYDPASFRIGRVLSLVTSLGWITGLTWWGVAAWRGKRTGRIRGKRV